MLWLLSIGSFGIAFLLSWGLNWLALIPWRRTVGRHWTERARLSYPVGNSARLNTWMIAANLSLSSYILFPQVNFFIVAISGFLGSLLARYFLSREIYQDLKFKLWFHLAISWQLLFFPSFYLLLITAFILPDHFVPLTWIIAGIVLGIMVANYFGLRLAMLRWFRILHPAPDHLNALVMEVSQKMGIPVRRIWILSSYVGNAVAYPQFRELIFTDKLLAILSDNEIKAVCAHELAHLTESGIVLMIRGTMLFMFYPLIFFRPLASLGDMGSDIFTFLLLGILLLSFVGTRVARRMEKRADKIAVENQADQAVYARALERLYQSSQIPAVMSSLSNKVHPNLYDRMLAAGVTPDYPKPLPAYGQCWTCYLMMVCLIVVPSLILAVKCALLSVTPP